MGNWWSNLKYYEIAAFGHAFVPDEKKYKKFNKATKNLESDMQLIGKGLGEYSSTFRTGGLWKMFGGTPIALGNNLIVHNSGDFKNHDLNDILFEELFHYYQQTHMGFAPFLTQGLFEQMNYRITGFNPYSTPGTIEFGAKLGRNVCGTFRY